MKLEQALEIAERVKKELSPFCERIEIGGSIRRRKPIVGDIEIIVIPKPYDVGMFESGIATIVKKWEKVKGELPCKYTQRILPEGIKLDLFFATKENWGLIYALRTGSANYSHHILGKKWVELGYKSISGKLTKDGVLIPVYEESDLFELLCIPYVIPNLRNL